MIRTGDILDIARLDLLYYMRYGDAIGSPLKPYARALELLILERQGRHKGSGREKRDRHARSPSRLRACRRF